MALVTRADIGEEYAALYMKSYLYTAEARICYLKFAQAATPSHGDTVISLPENGGSMSGKWRRYENLTEQTTALQDGITPEGMDQDVTDITATALQYGGFIRYTDKLKLTTIDNYLLQTQKRLAYNMQKSLDTITKNIVCAGSNVIFPGTITLRTNVTSTDLITVAMVLKAVRLLESNDAMTYTEDMIMPTDGYGTSPIPESYIAIVHPKTTYTLRQLTGFTEVQKYANPTQRMPGEVGSIGQVRFIQSSAGVVFTAGGSGSIDVYGTLIFGTDAFGAIDMNALTVDLIINDIGSGGTSDPLRQRGTIGWKAAFTAKILNDNFMVRLEHAVAA